MRFTLITLVLLTVGFASCENMTEPVSESSDQSTENPLKNSALTRVACTEAGHAFQIYIDPDVLQGHEPTCEMDPTTGLVMIDGGEKFQLEAEPDANHLEMIRQDLSEDLMFTWEISEESDRGFLAQAKLPDGQPHYWHVFQVCYINGHPYFFRSPEGVNFTRQNVRAMKQAIEAITPIP